MLFRERNGSGNTKSTGDIASFWGVDYAMDAAEVYWRSTDGQWDVFETLPARTVFLPTGGGTPSFSIDLDAPLAPITLTSLSLQQDRNQDLAPTTLVMTPLSKQQDRNQDLAAAGLTVTPGSQELDIELLLQQGTLTISPGEATQTLDYILNLERAALTIIPKSADSTVEGVEVDTPGAEDAFGEELDMANIALTTLTADQTATGPSAAQEAFGIHKLFQFVISAAATVQIEGSNDGVNWAVLVDSSKTSSGLHADSSPWKYVRSNVTSYTSGTVSVVMTSYT